MTVPKRECYGVPSIFNFNSKTCSACPDFASCQRASHTALKVMAGVRNSLIEHERFVEVPVTLPLRQGKQHPPALPQPRISRAKHRKFELTDTHKRVIKSMPVRSGAVMEKLFKRGLDTEIRFDLKHGKRPLAKVEGYRSLKSALAHLRKGYDRKTLRTYFMDELGWSNASAWNEVSLIWGVLPAIGVSLERDGRMVVAPNVMSQND